MKYGQAENKDSDKFDDFIADFFASVTDVQDPGTADGTLADLTDKFNDLVASMKEAGIIGV